MVTKVGIYRDGRNKRRPWIVRWFGEFDPTKGKQRHYSKAFTHKRDAEVFRAARQAELDRGGARDRPGDISLAEFTKRFIDSKLQNRRPVTRGMYSRTLAQLAEFAGAATPIRLVTREVADRFIATRDRIAGGGNGLSPWTRNRHLSCAKRTFAVAVEWGYLAENPFSHIKAERCSPRKWHHLNPDEFRTLLAVVGDLRWRAFYLLAYTTGARFGELFNLTWADIDFARSRATVRNRPATAQTPPFYVKDYESRTLLLPQPTIEALLVWQSEAPEGVPYILLTNERWRRVSERWQLCRKGKPWKRNGKTDELEWAAWENRHMVNNVGRDIRAHLRRAGVKTEVPFTVHTLRKSFGQNHADAGTPLHVLQKLMGHSSIVTTREFYLSAADANEREAVSRYEALLGKPLGENCVRVAYERDSAQPAEKYVNITKGSGNG